MIFFHFIKYCSFVCVWILFVCVYLYVYLLKCQFTWMFVYLFLCMFCLYVLFVCMVWLSVFMVYLYGLFVCLVRICFVRMVCLYVYFSECLFLWTFVSLNVSLNVCFLTSMFFFFECLFLWTFVALHVCFFECLFLWMFFSLNVCFFECLFVFECLVVCVCLSVIVFCLVVFASSSISRSIRWALRVFSYPTSYSYNPLTCQRRLKFLCLSLIQIPALCRLGGGDGLTRNGISAFSRNLVLLAISALQRFVVELEGGLLACRILHDVCHRSRWFINFL